MEFELFISGIGGQGVQLVGKVLALAATAQGRYAQLTGEYGGSMRGGSTVATVVIGDGRLHALPVVPEAGAAIALHRMYWEPVERKLRPGSLVVFDPGPAADLPGGQRHRLIPIAAAEIAAGLGSPQSAGLVMLGAFNAITGLVGIEPLVQAMQSALPPYRRALIESNERALREGDRVAPRLAAAVAIGMPADDAGAGRVAS
ncbi:MAG: 2-oxoacid:acceptor oxidoreductase family protein [Gammaproteobacteria bacterium]